MGKYPFVCLLLTLTAFPVSSEELIQEQSGEGVAVNTDHPRSQALQEQKDQLFGLLAQVDERYGDVSASLKAIETQIANSNIAIDKLRKEIGSYQDQIDTLDKELSGQVRAAYAMGQQDKLKLMLNQRDPALSSRMMVYYEYINKSRLEKLSNIQQTVRYLDQLDKEKQTEAELLEKNLGQKKTEQAALEQVRKQRNNLVKQLNDDFSSEDDQLSLLKESETKLINLIGTLEKESDQEVLDEEGDNAEITIAQNQSSFPKLNGDFTSLKGKLPLPVKGKLASMFDNPSATDGMWKGVVINTHEGAEIKAITKGRIVYAGALKGYGLLIIVEHDKEFMTLYAFNQSLYKHKGDWVEAGDVIATVGQSGGRTTPGLYFEIRKNGKAVDPLLWCRN
ncbi:MAG: peptidoglycan DD-metalloendopeptidase family protein [Methylococcaceae bacterium]|nr:peptidoglycan DD-metalloendopeptidase family protein [Methylococcaceae bacterium]